LPASPSPVRWSCHQTATWPPHPSPPPSPTTAGSIAARKADVFACYEKRRLDDPSLKGEVLITWTVKSDGTSTVSFAADINEVLTGTKSAADRRLVDDAALQACVTALDLRFPVDDQPQRKRSVPFRFGL